MKNILIAIMVLIFILCFYQITIENWTIYQSLPYGNYYTAPEPLNFYNKPRYRKPYKFPACVNVGYPVPHCRHLA